MRIVAFALAFALGSVALPAAAQLILSTDPPPQPQAQPKAQKQSPPIAEKQPDVSIKPKTPVTEAATPAPAPSRYRFHRVSDGFLRFDGKTGKVIYCSAHSIGWVCQDVPENGAAFEREITHLQNEVVALKNQIAALRAPAPAPPLAPARRKPPAPPAVHEPPPATHSGDAGIKLPTQADMARARAYFADTWHRLMDLLVAFQKNIMHKG